MEQATDTYKTIEVPSTGLFKDKGSKFLSFAYPINSEIEVKEHLNTLKKEYFDARHHCYAWAYDPNRSLYRVFDDGEPSGTAGKPIMGQIQSFGLTNILIVVVRYFGGTLLGTSGLIHAYRMAAENALNNAKIVEKTVNQIIKINFDYLVMNNVMKILKDECIEQVEQEFNLNCSITVTVRKMKYKGLIDKLKKIESVQLDV